MNISLNTITIHQDPLGLKDLPLLTPDRDGWSEVRSALEGQKASRQKKITGFRWLALAASLVLAVLITTRQEKVEPISTDLIASQNAGFAADERVANIDSLISLSQTLEAQLRTLRDSTGSMPASSVIYVAELEDLVAQVDSELSHSPESLSLWGQRVNLLLDLAQIYQHHWETEYGQMASL